LAARETSLAEREQRIKRRGRELEQEAAAAFVARARAAEHEIGRLVAELQRTPTPQGAAAARAAVAELRAAVTSAVGVDAAATSDARPLAAGDRVRVRGLGTVGEVVTTSDREVEVRAGAMTVRAKPDEVERVAPGDVGRDPWGIHRPTRSAATSPSGPAVEEAVRTPGNTVDLRGERVEEGLAKLERFLDEAMLRNVDAVFVLHGHGTGAMKDAVRRALAASPYVSRSGPASPEQGGDAFTVAVLRG
jgi:DNA mismatch repair protein MutS2